MDDAAPLLREGYSFVSREPRVVLLGAVEELLCRAVRAWAGIPLGEAEARERTAELAAMADGAGSPGPRNVRGHLLRRRTERRARRLVREPREGQSDRLQQGTAAARIARHRDLEGRLLDEEVAAVELITVLRPTVAVAHHVVFAAAALHAYPAACEAEVEPLLQEVRRFHPFFPAVAGRVREPFAWRDVPPQDLRIRLSRMPARPESGFVVASVRRG